MMWFGRRDGTLLSALDLVAGTSWARERRLPTPSCPPQRISSIADREKWFFALPEAALSGARAVLLSALHRAAGPGAMALADPPDETEIVERSPCGRYSRVRARRRRRARQGAICLRHETLAGTAYTAAACSPSGIKATQAAAPSAEAQLSCRCLPRLLRPAFSANTARRALPENFPLPLCVPTAVQSAAGPWLVQGGVQGVRRGGGHRGSVVPGQHGPCG